MPTDDIFDAAWNVAAGNDEIKKYGFIEGLARDFGFTDYANRMRERQEARDALNIAIRDQLVLNPNALADIRATQTRLQQEAQEQAHMDALEARLAELQAEQSRRADTNETIGDTMASPPDADDTKNEEEAATSAETVLAAPPKNKKSPTSVKVDSSLTPVKPKPPKNKKREAEVGESFEEPKKKKKKVKKSSISPDENKDVWSIVKDPFANPFFNENAFALTDEKPPEVTHDTTPVFEVDTSLIKGPSPEDALKKAGFDTRQGDDVSLLPSSVFRQGESAPVDNMSLLPKGWKKE